MILLQHPELLFEKTTVYKITTTKAKEFNVKSPQILLVFDETNQQLAEPVMQMLSKLVAACGFKDDEKLLINVANETLSLSHIQNQLKPKLVLLFGELKLGGNISALMPNSPALLGNNVFIKTQPLNKLVSSDAEKASLWKAIKQALTQVK